MYSDMVEMLSIYPFVHLALSLQVSWYTFVLESMNF